MISFRTDGWGEITRGDLHGRSWVGRVEDLCVERGHNELPTSEAEPDDIDDVAALVSPKPVLRHRHYFVPFPCFGLPLTDKNKDNLHQIIDRRKENGLHTVYPAVQLLCYMLVRKCCVMGVYVGALLKRNSSARISSNG